MPDIFMPFYAISCPSEILKNYEGQNSESVISAYTADVKFVDAVIALLTNSYFALLCNTVATLLFLLVLFLNQKKYNKSTGLSQFCWNYIGIQFVLCFLNTLQYSYQVIWNRIWYSNIICVMNEYEKPPVILPPFLPGVVYPRWYYAAINLLGYINQAVHNYTLPLLLGFHRLSVYFACSFPFIFNKYFKDSLLKYYYIFIDFQYALYVFDIVFNIVLLLSCSFHVVLTILAIVVMQKYRKVQSKASDELKGFFYLSILPMVLSILSMFLNMAHIVLGLMTNTDPDNELTMVTFYSVSKMKLIIETIILLLEPIFASILMIFCVPAYRIAFFIIISRSKKIGTTLKIQNSNSISSKIPSVSQRVVVTHK